MRVIQTEASTRFVGTASFAGITGAPVLDHGVGARPAARRVPRRPAPAHAPLSHLELVETADVFLVAPASANTIAKLAAGQADNLLAAAALACRRPLRRRARDERRDVRAPRHAGQPRDAARARRDRARARARARSARRGSGGSAGCPSRPSCSPPSRPRSRAAAGGTSTGLRVLVTAGGTREPIDAVRFVGNRSSGRMGFALAERGRPPRRRRHGRRRQRRAAAPPRRHLRRRGDRRRARAPRASAAFDRCDVLLMAAAVADYRPAEPRDGQDQEGPRRARRSRCAARAHGRRAGRARRRAGAPSQVLVGFAAETGRRRARVRPRQARAQAARRRRASTTSPSPGIGFDAADNEVTILTAGRRARTSRGPPRTRSRAPSSTPS